MLKKFLIWLIKNLIILLVATLIFSSITLDFPNVIKGVFGDIFAYASPDVQKRVVNGLTEACSSLDRQQNVVTVKSVCSNRSLLDSMKRDCQSYIELKRRNTKIDGEAQIIETCAKLESGEIERVCNEPETKSSLLPDFSKIGTSCKDYNNGKIDDKEFFFNVVSSPFSSQQMEMPQINALKKYNQIVTYLNSNRIIYLIVVAFLIAALYLLIRDIALFLLALSRISLSLGIFILLPYIVVLAYDKFVGIDTTPVLGSIFGVGNVLEPKAIVSVILLLFLRTYNSIAITLGIILLCAGVSGNAYLYFLKRKGKTTANNKKKNLKDLLDELEQSSINNKKEQD